MFCGWLGDRIGQRILVSMGGLTVALLGMILIVALPLDKNSGRLAGYYLTQASPAPFVALLSLISTNIAGYTKKTTVAAMYLVGYCVGNIIVSSCSSFVGESAEALRSLLLRGDRILTCKRTGSSNVQTEGRASLCPRRNHDYRVLGPMSAGLGFHLVVLQAHELEEGAGKGGTGVCQVGESGVSSIPALLFPLGSQHWMREGDET